MDSQATRPAEPPALTVTRLHGTLCVVDPEGGVWHPSDEASAEIEASESPEATAIRICDREPMRGSWAQ